MERCGLLDLLENPEALEAVSLGYVGSMVVIYIYVYSSYKE